MTMRPPPQVPPVVWNDPGNPSHVIPGETLEKLLAEALKDRHQLASSRDYSEYERRAIRYMTRHRALIPDERDDVRFFQCRACGFNPNYRSTDGQTPIRKWFWSKHEESCKDLVRLSRWLRVRFFRGKRNIISTEVEIPL